MKDRNKALSQHMAGQVAKAWDVLVGRVRNDQRERNTPRAASLTYKQFRNAVLGKTKDEQVSGTGAGDYLFPIQAYCQAAGLFPLTGLVVLQDTGLPSTGYIGSGTLRWEEEIELVLSYDWVQHGNPFATISGIGVDESSAIRDLNNEEGGESFNRIKSRGYKQVLFRKALLEAYDGCVVCGLKDAEILEAAHIKAWAVCEGNEGYTIANGLLLCRNHHRAFDLGYWSVDDHMKVLGSTSLSREEISAVTISRPRNGFLSPNDRYLSHHREKFNY